MPKRSRPRAPRFALAPRPPGYVAPGLWVGEAGRGAALLRAGQVLRRSRARSPLQPTSDERWQHCPTSLLIFTTAALDDSSSICSSWMRLATTSTVAAALDARPVDRRASPGVTTASPGGCSLMASTCSAATRAPWGTPTERLASPTASSTLPTSTVIHTWLDLAGAVLVALWHLRPGDRGCRTGSLAWPRVDGGELIRPAWCHGAAGIGRFLLRAARVGIPDAERLAFGAASATATAVSRWPGRSVPRTSPAPVEFLLDTYQTNAGPCLPRGRSPARVHHGRLLLRQ